MPIPVDEIHLWCADPDEIRSQQAYATALAIIAAEERDRLERFVFVRDRLTYLTTRALVRSVLSKYHAVAPPAWRFVTSSHGRPEISPEIFCDGGPQLRFNLSNANGLVVCAVVREADVGVDVERVGRDVAHLEIAERFFAPREVQVLSTLPPEEQLRQFYRYWTLKESYVKARGLGLALPLDQIAFVFEPDRPPRLEVDFVLGDLGDSWQFVQLEPTVDHVVALCMRRREQRDANLLLRWQPMPFHDTSSLQNDSFAFSLQQFRVS